MSTIDRYIEAATRENTRRSYSSSIRHFEEQWQGFLPATADSVTRYLAEYAESLSVNTLKLRLAALAQWHIAQGFPDPTKTPLVKKVLKGIQALHPAQEKRARPIQIEDLDVLIHSIESHRVDAEQNGDRGKQLRLTRDKALVLIGFWRGFRNDELCRLEVENIHVTPGEGMTMYLQRTKADRQSLGTEFKAPVLSRLCPVAAYLDWTHLAHLTEGPVFCRINRWGHVSTSPLNPNSITPLLRRLIDEAGISSPEKYSGHSFRRGFATWATDNQWDLKSLMEYVGWKDVKSAMRYVERTDSYGQYRIESALSNQITCSK